MAQFSSELLKKFIAPRIDERPIVILPDLAVEFSTSATWMQQYFLSSVFQGEFTGETRLYAESLIARVQMMFGSYQQGRAKLIAYADGWSSGDPGIGRYLAALAEWEAVFLSLQVAYDLLRKFIEATISDGDREDRTRVIANRIKHVADDIRDGKLVDNGLPMWVELTGFATCRTSVTFEELSDQVRFMGRVADCLSMPSQAKDLWDKLDQLLAGDPNFIITP